MALGDLGDPATIPGLLAALHDPDDWVNEEAVSALAKFSDPRIVPALIDLLAKVRNKNVLGGTGTRIVAALGKLRDERSIDLLLQILPDEHSPHRYQVAETLCDWNDVRFESPLRSFFAGLRPDDPGIWNPTLRSCRARLQATTLR